jgi:hypothetical protein
MGELDRIRARQLEVASYTEVFMDGVLGPRSGSSRSRRARSPAAPTARPSVTPTASRSSATSTPSTPPASTKSWTWTHRAGRQAKYLETPFKAAIPRYEPVSPRARRGGTLDDDVVDKLRDHLIAEGLVRAPNAPARRAAVAAAGLAAPRGRRRRSRATRRPGRPADAPTTVSSSR